MTSLRQATYNPAIFDVASIQQAKHIILTPEGGSTAERWAKETPYLVSLIERDLQLDERSLVLDYGCGIGRMAKALIERFGCRVVGVDISPSMRALAASYVLSDRFFACAPEALDWLGVTFDAALAVWVLQHCHQVCEDIGRIHHGLRPGGQLFVVNDQRRIVPAREVTWINDGLDVRAMLGERFAEDHAGELDPEHIGKAIADASYCATFRRN